MKKNLLFGILTCLLTFQVAAQGEFYPPNPNITDFTLSKFLTELTLAIGKKDKTFILEHLDPNILNSFGGDGGIEEFKEIWHFDEEETDFWSIVEDMLLRGASKFKEGSDYYFVPYSYEDWPDEYDPFEHILVYGSNINVRDTPSLENSKVVGQLNFQIVKYNNSTEGSDIEGQRWAKITTVDDKLSGYVSEQFLVSPVGYRMGLRKIEKGWVISMLVAGD